jgi:bacillopeptidase F (M6 metalloprotease family)
VPATHTQARAFWSNKGDQSDMTLTREFDLTSVSGPVEFSYRTWYDIEEGWDFLYLLVSEEGGPWEIITTPSGTAEDLSGNSHGWAYTGATGDWIEEKVDLSAYAGRKIKVRFEYVTDGAVYAEGFLLDDVRLDAINYSTDFEKDDGGWTSAGFVRVENILPQTFRLALITCRAATVQTIEVVDELRDPLSEGGEKAIWW